MTVRVPTTGRLVKIHRACRARLWLDLAATAAAGVAGTAADCDGPIALGGRWRRGAPPHA